MSNADTIKKIKANREAVLRLISTKPKDVASDRVKLPDFIVIGAPKSGTTAIEQYLHQHPEIYMSPLKNPAFFIWQGKERLFYGRNVVNSLASYHALFQYYTTQKVAGEVSPGYLPDHSAPERMKALVPDVKLIAILRNPVERAFSQFWFNRQIGAERFSSFRDALAFEKQLMQGITNEEKNQPKYIRGGFYHRQLMRYFEFFSPANIKIILYDDFRETPAKVMEDIFLFLGVNHRFVCDVGKKHNVTRVPKYEWMDRIAGWLQKFPNAFVKKTGGKLREKNAGQLPAIPDDIRKLLEAEYAEDIVQLGQLLNRDLSFWLKGQHRNV